MTEPRRNRGWIWFFVVLAGLTVTAITILVVFNMRQQLTREQLAAAEAIWKEKGPRDYDVEYTEEGSISNKFTVKVRAGQVVAAEPDDRPLEQKRAYYGMPAMFGFIEDFLQQDAQPGKPRTFTIASFDPNDGHLLHYIRSVMGTQERLEITVVRFTTVPETTGPMPATRVPESRPSTAPSATTAH